MQIVSPSLEKYKKIFELLYVCRTKILECKGGEINICKIRIFNTLVCVDIVSQVSFDANFVEE